MPYVLPDTFLLQLIGLRAAYQKRRNVTFGETPQPSTVGLFFGGIDVDGRDSQIKFIEQWLKAFSGYLKPDLDFKNMEELSCHLIAIEILIAVALFTNKQVDQTYFLRSGINSVIEQLLEEALGLEDNYLDEDTRAHCLLAARTFLNEKTCFERVKAGFDKELWEQFNTYVNQQCDLLDRRHERSIPSMRPLMVQLFSKPSKWAGCAAGYMLGDSFARSTALMPIHGQLTTVVGSGICLAMGGSASMGVMFLAPIFASRFLDTVCGVSIASILGETLEIVGASVGWGVGFSMDLFIDAVSKTCQIIANAYRGEEKLPGINGFILLNGHRVINRTQYDLNSELVNVEIIEGKGVQITWGGETKFLSFDEYKTPGGSQLKALLSGPGPVVEEPDELHLFTFT